MYDDLALAYFWEATCVNTRGLYRHAVVVERAWDGRGGVLEVSIFLGKLGFTLSITTRERPLD